MPPRGLFIVRWKVKSAKAWVPWTDWPNKQGRSVKMFAHKHGQKSHTLRILDPPMEGWMYLYSRGRVLKIASFEGPMILRVGSMGLVYLCAIGWYFYGINALVIVYRSYMDPRQDEWRKRSTPRILTLQLHGYFEDPQTTLQGRCQKYRKIYGHIWKT